MVMITLRPASQRGHSQTPWLESFHTFSFAEYIDPNHHEYRTLRVINEDFIQPRTGFPTHFHRDMEIITYMLAGEVAHEDSLGNRFRLKAGDVQRMTAGAGIQHSEMNPSDEVLHLLQIWIRPAKKSLTPSYEQRHFTEEEKRGRLCLIASPDGEGDSLRIHQETRVYSSCLKPGEELLAALASGRGAWVQVARGELEINGQPILTGDGASIEKESQLEIHSTTGAELLLFDLG